MEHIYIFTFHLQNGNFSGIVETLSEYQGHNSGTFRRPCIGSARLFSWSQAQQDVKRRHLKHNGVPHHLHGEGIN